MKNIIFKNGYTIEDLKKEKRVVFFDIDSTLGGNSTHHGLYSFKEQRDLKKEKFKKFQEKYKIPMSGAEYQAVDISCLAMFLRTLKDTNSVAFCVSSWVGSFNCFVENTDMNPIYLIEKVFQDEFPQWENGIIVGGSSESPSSRGQFCKELSEYVEVDYLIIDDSYHEYDNKDGLIEVDGNCGYIYRNHCSIIDKWKN